MAVYDPNDAHDMMELFALIDKARERGKKLKITADTQRHTNPQRKYLHFALSYFASEYGCTLIEAKETYLKRQAAPTIFDTGRTDKGGRMVVRSTSELSEAEYSSAIANFRSWAEMNGISIPDPDDKQSIRYCEQQIEKTKFYGTC